MEISDQEFISRLHNLVPCRSLEVTTTYPVIADDQAVLVACGLVEDISEQILLTLSDFSETDIVLDLKDAVFNVAVLGRFLGIIYHKSLGGTNERSV